GGFRGTGIYRDRGPNPRPNSADLVCLSLNRGHIVVREAKMVADLVDQHMADDMAEALVVLGPIVQDRPAVEPDHVGQPRHVTKTLLWQADALEQAEQVELALAFHLVQDLLGREVIDTEDHAFAKAAKLRRQASEDVVR